MKRTHLLISVIIHFFLVLFLIFFSWKPEKKDQVIERIEMINVEPVALKQPEQKEEKPISKIPEKKEEDIVVPKKKIIKRRIIKKPKKAVKPKIKPLPKLKSSLENKLKELTKEQIKTEQLNPVPDNTVKKKLLTPVTSTN